MVAAFPPPAFAVRFRRARAVDGGVAQAELEASTMSVDIHVERGGTLKELITLGSVRLFREVFHVAATNLGLKWLPDVIGRAGLHVDEHNLGEVLKEIATLEEHVPLVVAARDQKAVRDAVAKIRLIDQFLHDKGTTIYIG
jgi:hypothetical protein